MTQTSNSTIELRNSSFYEPERELTFVDPVKLEPELHLEIPVPVIRTELWDLNSGINRNLNQNSNIFVHFNFLPIFEWKSCISYKKLKLLKREFNSEESLILCQNII